MLEEKLFLNQRRVLVVVLKKRMEQRNSKIYFFQFLPLSIPYFQSFNTIVKFCLKFPFKNERLTNYNNDI